MKTARYVRWQNEGSWLGYFEDFPDYLTQGETVKNSKRTNVTFTGI
jgi:predicted RNase H-like HicB family nuclease